MKSTVQTSAALRDELAALSPQPVSGNLVTCELINGTTHVRVGQAILIIPRSSKADIFMFA